MDRLPGMGALVSPDGVGFRVWAPHASAVSVVGSFNDWDAARTPLVQEDDGYWYGFDATAKPGERPLWEPSKRPTRMSWERTSP